MKKNQGFVYENLLDTRKKYKPKYKNPDLVRAADLRGAFSQGDLSTWSYKLNKVTAIINDTVPSHRIDQVQERYNEALLKKKLLTIVVEERADQVGVEDPMY